MYDYRSIIDKLQNSNQHKSIILEKRSYVCLNHCLLCNLLRHIQKATSNFITINCQGEIEENNTLLVHASTNRP